MPEIKLKHVISFSSEDKVHKAENLIKPETYRKWKCATPGEKNATIVLQLEKASQIHSIDIGNDGSAFIEVLVGRSSDNVNDFQVLLVASSFMSPLESRNETHTNRVRMFGPEKLSQNVMDEKWDCVQIVCTQPFNKNISYGLSFIKFHSPPEKNPETSVAAEAGSASVKLGAFKVKSDDEDSLLSVGSWFGKQKSETPENSQSCLNTEDSPSCAATVLASSDIAPKLHSNKRKGEDGETTPNRPPAKKSPGTSLKDFITYKSLDITPERKSPLAAASSAKKTPQIGQTPKGIKRPEKKKENDSNKPNAAKKPENAKKKAVPFNKLMEKVVFVLSGFVNPLRSELRDKAIQMGAKYKGDWDDSCTHLICAFLNTPKYLQVRGQDGTIVTKEWILDCHTKKTLLPWRDYMLGKYSKAATSSEDEEIIDVDEESSSEDDYEEIIVNEGDSDEEYQIRPKKVVMNNVKRVFRTNGTKSPKQNSNSKTEKKSSPKRRAKTPDKISPPEDTSETDDEEAIADFMADTDVDENSDSGGDTEDEIRKFENRARKNKNSKEIKESTSQIHTKPDVDDLPLPELPNLFKQKHFYLFGDFISSIHHDLQRYITAYNGVIEDYMSDKIKYVITDAKWDSTFEQALSENEDLIFIKPLWIYKCHEAGKFVPYHPYIVLPDTS